MRLLIIPIPTFPLPLQIKRSQPLRKYKPHLAKRYVLPNKFAGNERQGIGNRRGRGTGF